MNERLKRQVATLRKQGECNYLRAIISTSGDLKKKKMIISSSLPHIVDRTVFAVLSVPKEAYITARYYPAVKVT